MHALAGDLAVLGLPDLLRFLAASGTSGCLRLQGRRGHGTVWVDDGVVIAAERDGAPRASVDEVLCALLGEETGSFTFDREEPPVPTDGLGTDSHAVEALLGRAMAMFEEWRRLQEVVPSLDVRIRLLDEIPDDERRTVTAQQWSVLARIGPGCSVGALAERVDASELEVLRLVDDLVASGLAELPPPRSPARRDRPAPVRGPRRATSP